MKAQEIPLAAVEVVAKPARFHIDAAVRVVLHVRAEHFVLLEYADGEARVYESDAEGEIGAWFPIVVAPTFAQTLSELGDRLSVAYDALNHAVEEIRNEQRRVRCESVSTQPVVSGASVASVGMGGASSPLAARKRAELVLVRPGTNVEAVAR